MTGPPRYPSTGLSRHPSNKSRRVASGNHSQGASRNSSPGGLRAADVRGGPAGQGQESLARMALGMVGGPGRDASRDRGRERERGHNGR